MGSPALIPLSGIAPPIQNPLDQFSRLMGIKAAQQQLQTGQLQQQGLQQENQMRQIQIQDQQAMRQAYIDAQGDPDKFLQNLPKYGASFDAIQKARQGVYQMKTDLLNLHEKEFQQHQQTADLYNGFIQSVKSAPPEKRAQVWQQGAQSLQGLPGVQVPAQYPGDQNLDMLGYQGVTLSKTLENAKTQAEQYKFQKQGDLAAAETAQKQPFDPQKIAQLNLGMEQGWQVLHPGQPLPSAYRLNPNATQADFQRLDSLMKNELQAAGTKAQRDVANQMRQQSFQLAQQNFQARQDERNKPTADEQRRADLASNMGENLDALAEIAQRRPDLFGPVAGRWAGIKQWVGTDDPDIARLHAIHEYLGMASVGAHAMRNAQHVAAAADAVVNGFHNSPQAVLAAIGQAKNSLSTFQQDIVNARNPQGRPLPATAAPAGRGSDPLGIR